MFDTLLEDFDSETTRTRVTPQGFADVVESGAAAPPAEDDAAAKADANKPADTESVDEAQVPDESESWSDDPVRMYLTQMGEIPLLTRQEEITLAKNIEDTRREFRTHLLECDNVI